MRGRNAFWGARFDGGLAIAAACAWLVACNGPTHAFTLTCDECEPNWRDGNWRLCTAVFEASDDSNTDTSDDEVDDTPDDPAFGPHCRLLSAADDDGNLVSFDGPIHDVAYHLLVTLSSADTPNDVAFVGSTPFTAHAIGTEDLGVALQPIAALDPTTWLDPAQTAYVRQPWGVTTTSEAAATPDFRVEFVRRPPITSELTPTHMLITRAHVSQPSSNNALAEGLRFECPPLPLPAVDVLWEGALTEYGQAEVKRVTIDDPAVCVRTRLWTVLSEPWLVERVEWAATMGGKVSGSDYPNPHWFSNHVSMPVGLPPDVEEAAIDAAHGLLATLDDRSATVAGVTQQTWSDLGTAPLPRRSGLAMAQENAQGHVIVFGGGLDDEFVAPDVWRWNGASWSTALACTDPGVTCPTARTGLVMVYDPVRDEVVLHGGDDGDPDSTSGEQTWVWNGTAFEPRAIECDPDLTCPSSRHLHAAAYHRGSEQVVVFGGITHDDTTTWQWNGSTWTTASPATTPSARYGHAMVSLDDDRVLMFGGWSATNSSPLDDTWIWTGSNWQAVDSPAKPSPRVSHALVALPNGPRALLFGGATDEGEPQFDTWLFWNDRWLAGNDDCLPGMTCPAARSGHAMAYDPRGNQVLLFGSQASANAWGWRSDAYQSRPAQIFTVDLTSAQLSPHTASSSSSVDATSIDITFHSGGQGNLAGSRQLLGAELHVWARTDDQTSCTWRPLVTNDASIEAAQLGASPLTTSIDDTALLADVFACATANLHGNVSDDQLPRLAVAVTPRGNNGETAAQVATNYVEVRLHFRVLELASVDR